MITNKDIRVENGSLILNGDPYPLDGQSPEAIMQIVEDNSDTIPTENSDAPITSGGVFTANKTISDTIGDLTQTGITGASVAAQLEEVGHQLEELTATTLTGIDISSYNSDTNQYTAPTDGYVRMELRNANQYFYLMVNNSTMLGGEGRQVTNANDYMSVFVKKGMKIYYSGTVQTAIFYSLT